MTVTDLTAMSHR